MSTATKPLTYGDLPPTHVPGVVMLCPECDAIPDNGYSAERGDYWMQDDDEEVTCAHCGGPMELVRRVVVFEAYRAARG